VLLVHLSGPLCRFCNGTGSIVPRSEPSRSWAVRSVTSCSGVAGRRDTNIWNTGRRTVCRIRRVVLSCHGNQYKISSHALYTHEHTRSVTMVTRRKISRSPRSQSSSPSEIIRNTLITILQTINVHDCTEDVFVLGDGDHGTLRLIVKSTYLLMTSRGTWWRPRLAQWHVHRS